MSFRPLGRRLGSGRTPTTVPSARGSGTQARPVRSLNYRKIEEDAMRLFAMLPLDKQAMIPADGTLPEKIVAYGLILAGYTFSYQIGETGGRLKLGGSVVDFKVALGSKTVIVRVQGDYWHSLPVRKLKDQTQFEVLKSRGYLVFDAWESDVYRAFIEGRIAQYVDLGVQTAL